MAKRNLKIYNHGQITGPIKMNNYTSICGEYEYLCLLSLLSFLTVEYLVVAGCRKLATFVSLCLKQHQFVAVTEWSGGLYVSPTIAGSRPGSLIAGAWAAMLSLGQEGSLVDFGAYDFWSIFANLSLFSWLFEGYLEHTREIMEASKRLQKGVKEIPELFIIGRPDMTIVAFGSNIIDIFEVNDMLSSKGWHLNPLQRPNSIHICVTLQHVPIIDNFLKDLKDSVQTVKENPGPVSGGLAPIYGAAGKIPDRGMVNELLVDYMDNAC